MINIRKAEKKDIDQTKKLLTQVLEIHARLRPDIFISGTRKYTDEQILSIFENERTPVFVAADDEDKAVGYAFCEIEEPAPSNNMYPRKTLYIDDLCVDEDCRGRNVGKLLYNHVCEYARSIGCYNVTLHVWEGNDSARAFYEKMGFGVRKTMMERIL